VLAEANAAANRTLADARAKLEASVAGERAKLNAQAGEVALAAARKILGREVAS
jgi:F0F1-type ATP synthase membrane subunit b/b'